MTVHYVASIIEIKNYFLGSFVVHQRYSIANPTPGHRPRTDCPVSKSLTSSL